MKKEILYYSILTIIIASLLFFETNIFSGNTENTSKIIDVESFDKLDIDLACNIYVSIGDEQRVVFEGPESYLKQVETSFENGILKISCKKTGVFASLFGLKESDSESINVYVKLTNANQLIAPKKGNLISNETSLYLEIDCEDPQSISQNLRGIIKLLGEQFGMIRTL